MSGRPLLLVTLPLLTVLAICLYLRRRGRQDSDPPEPPLTDQPAAEPTVQQTAAPAEPAARQMVEPAAQHAAEEAAEAAAESVAPPAAEQTAGRDLGQVTACVRDNIQTAAARPAPEPVAEEPIAVRTEAAAVSAAPPPAVRGEPEGAQEEKAPRQGKTPEPAVVGAGGDALRELEAAVQPAQTDEQDRGDGGVRPRSSSEGQKQETPAAEEAPVAVEVTREVSKEVEVAKVTPVAKEEAPVTSAEAPVTSKEAPVTSEEAPLAEETQVAETEPAEAAQEPPVTSEEAAAAPAEATPSAPAPASGAEASEPSVNGAAETGADTASENSSDSGKGGSSASLEQSPPSNSPESAPLQTTVYDFLIPQKLCGRLIGKNGTFVNMLKARTGAHVIIRLHPVKSSVKICSVDGTQSEVDACLKMIREKFPVNKFPAMTLEQLNRPTERSLAVPDSQQLHLPQGVTCDVLVSAVVSAGQLFLQQHTHPTFRNLERLTRLMAACYADGGSTPELPRPVVASSICAAPVAGGWYRAQVVAFYPDSDELDVRFMDFGGYSRMPAALARQIRTDFMSLPFQAEECYLANVMPVSDDGWSLEAGAVFENLITDRALEAMVVGYAEDGTPFVNLYSIQGTEYGNSAISLVNQQLVESGAARWVENQA